MKKESNDDLIKNLTTELQTYKDKINTLKTEILELNNRIVKIDAIYRDKCDEVDELKDRLSRAEKIIDHLIS